MIREIVVANNSDLLTLGMTTVLERCSQNRIVGTATSFVGLLNTLELQQPHVIFTQESLYGPHIITSVSRLSEMQPRAKIILMGSQSDGLLIRDLFHAGISGYLYISDDLSDCLNIAVNTVMRERKYLSPTANAEYLVAMQSPMRDWHLDWESRKVLQMLAIGYSACEIADDLQIESRRVYFIRQKLRRRFNAQTNEHLIAIAAKEGFI